jgi:hypothetical protein
MQNLGEMQDTETICFEPSMSADFQVDPLYFMALPLMSTAMQNLEEEQETQSKEWAASIEDDAQVDPL